MLMVNYKIEYNKKRCIGAGVCEAVNAENFRLEETRKAELLGGKFNEETQMFEKIVDESGLDDLKRAAEGCPRKIIHITNLETGEKLF